MRRARRGLHSSQPFIYLLFDPSPFLSSVGEALLLMESKSVRLFATSDGTKRWQRRHRSCDWDRTSQSSFGVSLRCFLASISCSFYSRPWPTAGPWTGTRLASGPSQTWVSILGFCHLPTWWPLARPYHWVSSSVSGDNNTLRYSCVA